MFHWWDGSDMAITDLVLQQVSLTQNVLKLAESKLSGSAENYMAIHYDTFVSKRSQNAHIKDD